MKKDVANCMQLRSENDLRAIYALYLQSCLLLLNSMPCPGGAGAEEVPLALCHSLTGSLIAISAEEIVALWSQKTLNTPFEWLWA